MMPQYHVKVMNTVIIIIYCITKIDKQTNEADCQDGDVRLVGGSTEYEGRVEVCINRAWGTICDTNWLTQDSNVVCKQLGHMELGIDIINNYYLLYYLLGSISYSNANQFGQGTGPILMYFVHCFGNEDTLIQCYKNYIIPSSCSHYNDVGIKCEGKPMLICINLILMYIN